MLFIVSIEYVGDLDLNVFWSKFEFRIVLNVMCVMILRIFVLVGSYCCGLSSDYCFCGWVGEVCKKCGCCFVVGFEYSWVYSMVFEIIVYFYK